MQTNATSHNIVSPTMLGVVGTCCAVHANERNNCQHCWRLSKEAMHSGTVILKKDYNAHAQTFSRGQHCCGSMQTDATCLAQGDVACCWPTMLRQLAWDSSSPFLFIQNGRICWELDNIDFSGKGFDAAYRKRNGIGSFQPSPHPLPLRLKLEKRFPDKKNFV